MCVCSLCVVVLFENLNHKPRTTLKKRRHPNDLEFWRLAFGVGVWRLAFGVWRLAFGVWRLAFGVGATASGRRGALCCGVVSLWSVEDRKR